MAQIKLNGEKRSINNQQTLGTLLNELGLDQRRVAAVLNDDIVDRGTFDQTPLVEGDSLELITLVGGG